MPKGGDRFDKLPKDDPNYEIGKRFYLEAWADSHALVAEGFSGRLSFSDFVESCIRTFCHAAEAQVAFKDKDDVPVPARCQALDEMAKKFIRKFKQALRSARQRLGEANVEAAIDQLSRRVNEIAALSKQQILEEALARSTTIKPAFSHGPATFVRRSTRAIVMQRFGPDRVADIKVPKLTYDFPPTLPASVRAKVHAERLGAEQDLAERKGSVKDFSDAESRLVELVLRVFCVYSNEVLNLGSQGRSTVGEVDSEVLKFLKAYAFQAGFMDNLTLVPTTNIDTEIPDNIWRQIESAEQWKEYRRKLQLVAEAQAEGVGLYGGIAMTPAKRGGRVPDLDISKERLDLRATLDGPAALKGVPTPVSTQTRVPLHAELKEAESRTADPKLRNKLMAVFRYNRYFEDLKVLKTACKRYQTPALLEQNFRDLDVWAAMSDDDKVDIAKGDFQPGIFAWSLVKRLIGLTGHDNRTLKNYRNALRGGGLL